MTDGQIVDRASLEGLVETGMLALDSLHPGGLEITRELAALCNIERGDAVLDVACGTGETACFLAGDFGARAYGVDRADEMIRRAEAKANESGLEAKFIKADAARLPFGASRFDAAICESTLSFLDKPQVLREMARVVRPGGCIGMHDLCWKKGAPDKLKHALARIESEQPETLMGWRGLFERAGLGQITAIDKSEAKSRWMQESRKQLGWTGELLLAVKIIRRWGIRGGLRFLRSERVFSDDHLGYVLVVGRKG